MKFLGELNEEERHELTPNTYISLHKAEQLADMKLPAYNHHEVRGIWLWGEPGTGKSH